MERVHSEKRRERLPPRSRRLHHLLDGTEVFIAQW